MTASRLTVEALPKPERCSQLMGSAVVSTAPVGVPPTGRQRSPQLTKALNGEWNLLHHLFGETPNRATGTVALPFSDCIVPAKTPNTAGLRAKTGIDTFVSGVFRILPGDFFTPVQFG